MKTAAILAAALLSAPASAFVPQPPTSNSGVLLRATEPTFDPLNLSDDAKVSTTVAAAATAAVAAVAVPLAAVAEEADDYEYGAVDAPIGIAVGGGILAILTALLPVALRGGEEAFEEMKENDSDKWGKF
uniref:Uncharacterized protein n=1 Tax=Trieres chinensis TaxID=1514140 RepID=A0A7S2A631_TRICV|mmetsp:Transcript_4284/g.9045  ORF Transcript_4284/g.9045 Transcript_4284/m.9045 type:complete len:130 (+) Transcript_4284:69-458(+)|eukprot:CAMPEP_0183290538 /NCGR_PEP_ID=MMETSP0160_2-20130417/175_1 /TAXON_ID=2839 ORGANISM="Odontella Sinensis, Strain Grunow 1884" /NCGR_SAMPLE_ID=MMETSP0160_2 /ASSEMBLY_ACC=CAM_ASM_000250 /LENGTH=129 /DNA_ID=CAMNT_0025451159 /DNA_START=34 /DNA_END=423 /DNA_ORIENTATION=-